MPKPTPAQPTPPALHSVEDAAARVGVGRSDFYVLLRAKEIESVKIGRRRLIPEAAIVDFIEKLRGGAA